MAPSSVLPRVFFSEGIAPQLDGTHGALAQVQACIVVALLVLGCLRAAAATSAALRYVWRQFLRPAKNLQKYGTWAIVTGGTDGIGREYANCLAKKGMNIYLVSRTEAKLQAAATEIASKYGVEAKYYAADLAAAGAEPMDNSCWYGLRSNIAGMDIGVLINNAGMSYDHPEYFHQLDQSIVESMCALNNAALVKMTYTVLPGMVQRGRGAIINMSSASATFFKSAPLLSLYAASKAFVDNFSLSLAEEYRSKGIDVQVQSPMHVTTKMSKIRRSSVSVPTPKVYCGAAVRHIGYEPAAVPYMFHALEAATYAAVPDSLVAPLMKGVLAKTRAKALKKKAAAAKTE